MLFGADGQKDCLDLPKSLRVYICSGYIVEIDMIANQ